MIPSLVVLAACLWALPLCANAGYRSAPPRSRHQAVSRAVSHQHTKRDVYTLEDRYTGQAFIDEWDFWSRKDPTNGLVDYLNKEEATSRGLAVVNEDGTTRLSVDNTTQLNVGQPRASVRISTKKKYNGGLIIADIIAMPHGCATWPAFWTVGDNWPHGGEIDILEGVNEQKDNRYTLHTGPNCILEDANIATSRIQGTTCATINGDNTGCAFKETEPNSYGHDFNAAGGGVYATLWDDSGISIWFVSRCKMDDRWDIEDDNPDPGRWGPPSAYFPASGCNVAEHFSNHVLTIDTTLCGDWAGAAYGGSCPGTCEEAVADPSNFKTAFWEFASITVYTVGGKR